MIAISIDIPACFPIPPTVAALYERRSSTGVPPVGTAETAVLRQANAAVIDRRYSSGYFSASNAPAIYLAFRSRAQSPLSGGSGDVHWGPSAFERGTHFPVRGLNQAP